MIIPGMGAEAERGRVFFLAQAEGIRLWQDKGAQVECFRCETGFNMICVFTILPIVSPVRSCFQITLLNLQDLNLRPLQQILPSEWNALSRPPSMLQWLQYEQSKEEQERLHALGNIVVPQQAVLGFRCLLEMHGAKRLAA